MRTMNASALTTTIEPMTTKRMNVSLVSIGQSMPCQATLIL